MWLHVGIFSTEELLDAVDGKILGLVNALASAIVAVAGITFGILVGEAASHSLHYLLADEVFTSDKLDAVELTLMFFLNNVEQYLVSFHINKRF